MSDFWISPYAIFFFITLATSLNLYILQGKVERKTYMLVNSIAILPVIPVFWAMTADFGGIGDRFTLIYAPWLITLFSIAMLIVRIVQFRKK